MKFTEADIGRDVRILSRGWDGVVFGRVLTVRDNQVTVAIECFGFVRFEAHELERGEWLRQWSATP